MLYHIIYEMENQVFLAKNQKFSVCDKMM